MKHVRAFIFYLFILITIKVVLQAMGKVGPYNNNDNFARKKEYFNQYHFPPVFHK